MPRDAFVLKIQRELCHPKYARKVSGLSRNRPLITKLVESPNLDSLLELRNFRIFLLTFARFFRLEEVLHIRNGDVIFHDGYIVISLNISKTDQHRKGNLLTLIVMLLGPSPRLGYVILSFQSISQ